jgi:hypothetical protein
MGVAGDHFYLVHQPHLGLLIILDVDLSFGVLACAEQN